MKGKTKSVKGEEKALGRRKKSPRVQAGFCGEAEEANWSP